jgi:hypothetical protein
LKRSRFCTGATRSTVHVWAFQLDDVVRCGLGEHALPDIRSVYISHHNLNTRPELEAFPWQSVFSLHWRMDPERVAFEFNKEPETTELDSMVEDL